jgi:hypothetical protein
MVVLVQAVRVALADAACLRVTATGYFDRRMGASVPRVR